MPESYPTLRAPLAALADDNWLTARVAASALGSSANGLRVWKRIYERFEPEREPFATLVLESHGEPQILGLLEAFAEPPGQSACGTFHDKAVGWVRLRPFWSDESLPSLSKVLSRPGRRRVVRYRPYRRCTIRFEADHCRLFAKVYPDDRGRRLHADAVSLWEASARGELGFRVARPAGWDGSERSLWHEELGGAPVADELRSARGPELAERIGRALASLTGSSLAAEARFDAEAELRRTSRHGEELCRQIPRLRPLIGDTLDRLSRLHRRAPSRPPRPIHGAPHAHQWLDDGDRLGLIDFDRFCLGDPELDAATILAELDFEDRGRVPVAEIGRKLLAGYASGGITLDPELLLVHRVHKRIGKALKALRALRPDGQLRAQRRCEQAAALLEGVTA